MGFTKLSQTSEIKYTVRNLPSDLRIKFKVRGRTDCGKGPFSNEFDM